jgi:fluoroquinolone transport system permease protein
MRLAATIYRDFILQLRYGLYSVSVFVVVVWGVLLSLLPAEALADAATIVPAFLLGNLIVTTFYFMAALVMLEKAEGMLTALVTTPLRAWEFLASRIVTLTSLALVESLLIVVVVFGPRFHWGLLLVGSSLLSALYVLVGFAAVVRYASINEMLMPSVVFVMALVLPLISHFGLVDSIWMFAHPVQPALVLMQAAYEPVGTGMLAYGVVGAGGWTAAAFVLAHRRFEQFVVATAGA